jgi:2-phospho-L-lactate guanylyltransferase
MSAPKRRLRAVLSREERRGLSQAMLTDVLTALVTSNRFDRVLLVGRETPVLELGRTLGAEPLEEPTSSGYNAAAQQASVNAATAGAEALLIVPADLPLAESFDFVQLVEQAGQSAVALVASQVGGTNALLVRPPGAIAYQFGPDSFETHLRSARQASLPTVVLEIPALQFDVDRPGDLRRLLREGTLSAKTATGRFLAESGLTARLRRPAGSALPADGVRVAAARAWRNPL